jgi:hypothetical protein
MEKARNALFKNNKVLMLVLPINFGSEFSSCSVSTIPFIKMLNVKVLKRHLVVHHRLTKMVCSNHQTFLPGIWSLHIENYWFYGEKPNC